MWAAVLWVTNTLYFFGTLTHIILLGRWQGQPRVHLSTCLYFAYGAIYYAILIWYTLGHPYRPFTYVTLPLFVFMMFLCLFIAHREWNNYNRRRKKRPARASGRVALRLGRLTIVPEF